MRCTECYEKTKVLDSRESGMGTRRRHECPKCKKRITTKEVLFESVPISVPPLEFKEVGPTGDGRMLFVLLAPSKEIPNVKKLLKLLKSEI